MGNPVPLVHVVRDGVVEGIHYGSLVVLGPDGGVEFAAGDIESPFFLRSAAKPLQAVGLLRAGLELPDDLLALAAASHSGEDIHLAGTHAILRTAELSEHDLGNPPALPYDPAMRDEWLARGRAPRRAAHNCSGKHAAMLRTARARGWSTRDYLDRGHPLQRALAATVSELAGERVAEPSVDGCGAPLFSISLTGLARALARIATAGAGTAEGDLARALRAHPELVAGTSRDVTLLMRAVPGLIAKDGFEGVQVVGLPDGHAVAIKIADGADRARMPAAAAALALCGLDPERLLEPATVPVYGGGEVVGGLQAAGELASAALAAGARQLFDVKYPITRTRSAAWTA
ncbi:asparaginase [Amycolatopsis cihanbeyliensis]|uniref:Asparaginase n=1 Tax=Amycolatopsis cihanbeyliensis TaxID=1128664 RepID=A0A542DNB4_AMYCI|nr:asparaginase [Amycolatopsis cihanbeyliensis]TQJ04592.1 asparaginase [Amycolatopsis cihanbeyliensis]